jgi:hypothetical protein
MKLRFKKSSLLQFIIIAFFLSLEHPYPDLLTKISWAKAAWKEGFHVHEVDIAHTPDLLKSVCLQYAMNCSNIFVDHCMWKPPTQQGELEGRRHCL